MFRKFLTLMTTIALIIGCKGGQTNNGEAAGTEDDSIATVADDGQRQLSLEEERDELITQEPLPLSADELFDDFIFNFASNRRLQMERIKFPLLVNSGAKKEYIAPENWQMEHFFMHQGEYTLMFDDEDQMTLTQDTALVDVVLEKIFLEEAFVRQYLFSRASGRWMLEEIRNQTLPRNANAQFIAFYQQFVSDSTFQRESLADEIVFQGSDPDDDFAQMEGVITPDFWDAFRPELPQRMLFNIVYAPLNPQSQQKILVVRGISNGLEQELTFRLNQGCWQLVKLVE
ncbi:MAG: DUF4348 domain-containing protein [Prevotella sp.]|nr:DUF4348 domain-containing protein [Prevotella sp.]